MTQFLAGALVFLLIYIGLSIGFALMLLFIGFFHKSVFTRRFFVHGAGVIFLLSTGMSFFVIENEKKKSHGTNGAQKKVVISEAGLYSDPQLAGRYKEIFGKEFLAKVSFKSDKPDPIDLQFAAVIDANKIYFYPLRLVDGKLTRMQNLNSFTDLSVTFETPEKHLKLIPYLNENQWVAMLGVIFLGSKSRKATAHLSFEYDGHSCESNIELVRP